MRSPQELLRGARRELLRRSSRSSLPCRRQNLSLQRKETAYAVSFSFPLPCTTTLAATVSYGNRPTAPEMSRRPHPAPMRRQRRSPVLHSAARPLPGPALTGPWPTVTRSQGARHTAPPSLPRAAARSHRAPSPEYRPAAACTHWPRLVRIATIACRRPHRIYPTACRHPHPPMSPPSRFRAHRPPITTIVRRRRLTRVALRRPHRAHRAPTSASPPHLSLLALRRPQGPGWQEPRRMHPFFAECAKKALFLATSARNACFSRSRWQHPRPMHPFPGAIGRFGIHGARILPPRALFRVEEPEIMHGARMLPAPPGLSAAAACSPAERALHPAARAWPACRMRAPAISLVPAAACGLRHAAWPNGLCTLLSRFAVRDPPRGPRTDASRHLRAAPIPPAARTHRVQETSGTTQTTQCGHKNRIPK